jgi:DNA repair ATPase RecN
MSPKTAAFKVIEDNFGVTKQELISNSRKDYIIEAKQVFMYILYSYKKNFNISHSVIANLLNTDRTSVIHHLKQVDNYMSVDSKYAENVKAVKKEFETLCLNYDLSDIEQRLKNFNEINSKYQSAVFDIIEACKELENLNKILVSDEFRQEKRTNSRPSFTSVDTEE